MVIIPCCKEFSHIPQLDKVAELSGQRAQLIIGDVKRVQIDELVDVGRDALQRVVVQVQRGQVSQLEQLRRQGAHTSCYLQFLSIN